MNNDDALLKALEAMHEDINYLKQNTVTKNDLRVELAAEREHTSKLIDQKLEPVNIKLDHMVNEQVHVRTALKVVSTKGDVEVAVEAGNAKLKVDLVKKIQSHERRITNLEDKTGTPNPDKN